MGEGSKRMNRASRGVVRGESSGRPLASGASLQRLVLDNHLDNHSGEIG
jgi:hypothetical protein